jgi:hypothetical protein
MTYEFLSAFSVVNASFRVTCHPRLAVRLETPAILVSGGFPQSLQTNSGLVLKLSHDRFLPDPLKFIIYQSSYHSMLL